VSNSRTWTVDIAGPFWDGPTGDDHRSKNIQQFPRNQISAYHAAVIITVTPSPAVDWTLTLSQLRMGEVNRARKTLREPSGKGVNVAIALRRSGWASHAIIPGAGDGGRYFDRVLTEMGVAHTIIDTGLHVRTNLTLLIDGEPETKVNEPGYTLSETAVAGIHDAIAQPGDRASAVVTAGNLPAGNDLNFHRDIVAHGHRLGLFTVVDSSGEALAAALDATPDLVKPNVSELSEFSGRSLRTLGDLIDAAQVMRAAGAHSVLASMGADGALLVDEAGLLLAVADGVTVRSAVGAGDALLAGFVADRGERSAALVRALLWASSAVESSSTLFAVKPELAAGISVTDRPDRDRILRSAV